MIVDGPTAPEPPDVESPELPPEEPPELSPELPPDDPPDVNELVTALEPQPEIVIARAKIKSARKNPTIVTCPILPRYDL